MDRQARAVDTLLVNTGTNSRKMIGWHVPAKQMDHGTRLYDREKRGGNVANVICFRSSLPLLPPPQPQQQCLAPITACILNLLRSPGIGFQAW